jgi:hypothetical protein
VVQQQLVAMQEQAAASVFGHMGSAALPAAVALKLCHLTRLQVRCELL